MQPFNILIDPTVSSARILGETRGETIGAEFLEAGSSVGGDEKTWCDVAHI